MESQISHVLSILTNYMDGSGKIQGPGFAKNVLNGPLRMEMPFPLPLGAKNLDRSISLWLTAVYAGTRMFALNILFFKGPEEK